MTSANAPWGKSNWFRFYLGQMRDEDGIQVASLNELLGSVGTALTRSINQIDGLGASQDSSEDEMRQTIVDEECDRIEDLLGVAFVLCQRHITYVVSWAMRLHEFVKRQKNLALTCVTPTRRVLIQTASKPVSVGSAVTQVQAIEGFANYFKHQDEWISSDWSQLKGQSKVTADIITAAGAQSGSTGNFRKGAKALGNSQFNELGIFVDILSKWQEELGRLHEVELKARGII